MPSLPPRRAAAILLAGLVATLAGCGPGKDEFAPVCPHADLLWQAADLNRYRDESAGATQELRDLVLEGRIAAIDRDRSKCEPGETNKQLAADVAVKIQFARGPAMQGREADVPFFLAITEGDQIFAKKIYQMHVVFPPNIDQVTLTSEPVHMVFPVSPTKSGAAYTVLAGFQLTEQELAYNRRHGVAQP
jgi:hypothetical protein